VSLRWQFWKLDGQLAVPCESMLEWAMWFGQNSHPDNFNRRVDETIIGPMRISTIFLGLDHNFGRDGEPLIFETMIFRGGESQECWRSSSWQEAEADHKRAVELIRREIKENAI
jgi:hypothetical protein